jgi:hypothetical protein
VTNANAVEKPKTLLVYEGGKQLIPKPQGAGPKDGKDWLRSLGYGARFVCHPKNTVGCWLDQYGIAFVLDECILLGKTAGMGMELGWVDSRKFSNQYRLVAVLPEAPDGAEPDTEAGTNEHHTSGSTDG